MMKFLLTGLALALAGASTCAAAQASAAQGQKQQTAQPAEPANAIQPSKKAAPAIMALQTAVTSKDTANIPAKLAAAQAAATTKEDRYWIARIQLKAAIDSSDYPAATAALEAMQATGVAAPADLSQLYEGLGGLEFNAKQYAAAATAFQHQIAVDPNNANAIVNLAKTRAAAGNKADAAAELQRAIQAATAAGRKAPEELYRDAVGFAYDANLPTTMDVARQWATAYPGPDSWHDAIAITRNNGNADEIGTLALLRLMQATDAMKASSDYSLLANAALDLRNYREAQSIVDAGVASKLLDTSMASDLSATIKRSKKATAADLNAALKMSPSGANLLHIGDGFYGLGDYAKAAEVYRSAAAKGGIDTDVANLDLGMALVKTGDKAGAEAAFKGVTGPRAAIGKLWLLYLQQHG